jgi:hypothetical protein
MSCFLNGGDWSNGACINTSSVTGDGVTGLYRNRIREPECQPNNEIEVSWDGHRSCVPVNHNKLLELSAWAEKQIAKLAKPKLVLPTGSLVMSSEGQADGESEEDCPTGSAVSPGIPPGAPPQPKDPSKESGYTLFENKFPEHTPVADRQTFSPDQVRRPTFSRYLNYVVTKEGQLRLGRVHKDPGGGHIDLADGQPVRAAGEVKIVNGQIRWVDNSSGHYQPSGSSARRAAEEAFRSAGFGEINYIERIVRDGHWYPKKR